MLCLSELRFTPFPMKAKHRDSETVLGDRIDVDEAILVRDHLASPGHADHRAVSVTHMLAKTATEARKAHRVPADVESRMLSPITPNFEMVAAGKTELLVFVVLPPRHVDVGEEDAV